MAPLILIILLQAYSAIILSILLIKMLALSLKEDTRAVGITGIVALLPILLFVVLG